MAGYQDLRTVVQGEASESDDEPLNTRTTERSEADISSGPSLASIITPTLATDSAYPYHPLAVADNHAHQQNLQSSPMVQSLVVAGEASESDEEYIQIASKPESPALTDYLPALRVHREPERKSPPKFFARKSTYDSLLHKKLCEKNKELASQLEGYMKTMYMVAGRDVSMVTQQLAKSQSAIQEISHNMRMATNDLFHLEDRLDIVSSCDILPDFVGNTEEYKIFISGAAVSSNIPKQQ